MSENSAGNSGNLRSWPKGVSGNPSGRPSHATLRAALKPHEAETIEKLLAHMRGESVKVSMDAVKTILAYLHGKPDAAQLDDLSDDEMLAVILRRKDQAKQ